MIKTMLRRKKSLLLVFILFVFITPLVCSNGGSVNRDYSVENVVVFTKKICPFCPQDQEDLERQQYYLQTLEDKLNVSPINVTLLIDLDDYQDLTLIFQELNVPDAMRGSDMVVIIDGKYMFISYVPVSLVVEFLLNYSQSYERFIISKDPLQLIWYKFVLGETDEIKWCEIETSLEECIGKSDEQPSSFSNLPLIFFSGLLDGINPCAFSVLLFFIVFIFSASSLKAEVDSSEDLLDPRKDVRRIGSSYILGVWLAYLVIGLGLFQGIRLVQIPHLMGLASSLIVIFFGILNVADFFWPGRFSLRMSLSQWGTVRQWMRRFTVPTAFVAGLLVSVFEFPCTGGIYLSIIGLLAQNTSFFQGFIYLIIYNLAFVIPLISIVVFMLYRDISSFSLVTWEQKHGRFMRLILGLIMALFGVLLILWQYT